MLTDTRIMLESADRAVFEVEASIACQSQIIKIIFEETGAFGTTLLLPNVSSKTLIKVIEYCRYHVKAHKGSDEIGAVPEDQIKQWNAEFFKVDKATLFDLFKAANYPHIDNLLHLTCQVGSEMIKAGAVKRPGTFSISRHFQSKPALHLLRDEELEKHNQWALQ